jgi:hypothetical protein
MMLKHANEPPIPPSRRTEIELPAAFDEVVLACLAKHPETVLSRPVSWPTGCGPPCPTRPGTWNGPNAGGRYIDPPNAFSEECVECDMRLMPALTSEPDAVEQASGARLTCTCLR